MPCICPRIKKKTMIELAFKINITYQFNIVCEIMKFKDCHFKGAKYGAKNPWSHVVSGLVVGWLEFMIFNLIINYL